MQESLNLGCGRKRIDGALNLDISTEVGADVVHDLNQMPWPFASGRFKEVTAFDVIEHCRDVIAVMDEIHRVCRDGAIVKITVPHFSCANAFADPTHRQFFSHMTMDYFTGEREVSYYTRSRFRKQAAQIIFTPSLVNRVVGRLANRWPRKYESRWPWIFPAWFLYFELAVLKPKD
ncbi:MAG: methyltransferase domain-containing protein [Candidatus Binataceae bacterium]|nr:methyltransferase domain-containing protein [Candidatus Binataceae bacterium]